MIPFNKKPSLVGFRHLHISRPSSPFPHYWISVDYPSRLAKKPGKQSQVLANLKMTIIEFFDLPIFQMVTFQFASCKRLPGRVTPMVSAHFLSIRKGLLEDEHFCRLCILGPGFWSRWCRGVPQSFSPLSWWTELQQPGVENEDIYGWEF